MLKKIICCTETALKHVGVFHAAKINGVNYQADFDSYQADIKKCRVCDKLFSKMDK